MAALFGPCTDLHTFRSIDDLLDHFGVPEPIWRASEFQVGRPPPFDSAPQGGVGSRMR